MGITNYTASKLWRHLFSRSARWVPGPTRWTALQQLWTDDTIESGSMLELSQAGYARVQSQWGAPDSRGRGTNSAPVLFGPASEDWPPALGTVVLNASTAGNPLVWGINRPLNVNDMRARTGDTLELPAGSMVADFGYRRLDEYRPWLHPDCWSWVDGGRVGENLLLERVSSNNYGILRAFDRSANGRDWTNTTGIRTPGYRSNVTVPEDSVFGTYHTFLPLIGCHQWEDGAELFGNTYHFPETFVANGSFYAILAFTNSRNDTADRDLWGLTLSDKVTIKQGSNGNISITIGGQSVRIVDGQVPKGLVVLELWRNSSNQIFARINRVDVGVPGAGLSGAIRWDGFGEGLTDKSNFDDYLIGGGLFTSDLDQETRDEIALSVYERCRHNFQEWPQLGVTSYYAVEAYDHVMRGLEFLQRDLYLALIHRLPTMDDTGSSIDEADFPGYQRQLITFADDPASDGCGGNSSSHLWTPGSDVNRVLGAWGIVDSPTRKAGNALVLGHFEGPPLLKRAGQPIRIGRGDLTVNLNSN